MGKTATTTAATKKTAAAAPARAAKHNDTVKAATALKTGKSKVVTAVEKPETKAVVETKTVKKTTKSTAASTSAPAAAAKPKVTPSAKSTETAVPSKKTTTTTTSKKTTTITKPKPVATKKEKKPAVDTDPLNRPISQDTTSRVPLSQVESACKALLAFTNKQNEQRNLLVSEAEGLFIVLTMFTTPSKRQHTPLRIPLKHRISPKSAEVCLFAKDPQSTTKELLQKKNVQSIHKVIGLEKLRKKHSTYEGKRILCSSYGEFLADEAILPHLPKLLGKAFFTKSKLPLPVNIRKPNLGLEIERALCSTRLTFGEGPTIGVKIGTTEHSVQDLVDNVMAAIDRAVPKIPGGWHSLQKISLKSDRSMALPIFSQLPKA